MERAFIKTSRLQRVVKFNLHLPLLFSRLHDSLVSCFLLLDLSLSKCSLTDLEYYGVRDMLRSE